MSLPDTNAHVTRAALLVEVDGKLRVTDPIESIAMHGKDAE